MLKLVYIGQDSLNCTELLDLVLFKIVGPVLERTGVEYCFLMKLHAEDL